MDDTKGDNDSISEEATAEDTNVDADNDKTDDNDDEKNKEEDEKHGTQEETADEEREGTDGAKDEVDKDNADEQTNKEEGKKDDEEDKIEDEEVEKDENDHHNKLEEEDNKEDEVNECEPSANKDEPADEEETEDNNEEAAAEGEEGKEGVEEEEAGEDNTEQNGSQDLTEEEITRCRFMFDKKAIDGRLDLKGFKTVFRVLGEIIASEEAELMFESGDRDGDNTIDLDEFLRLYSKYRQEEEARREAILESVDKLFLCGSGDSIELKKVLQLLLKLQQPDLDARLVREKSDLGVDEVKRLVKSMDKNGDGCISKQEFVNILCEHLDI